MAEKPKHPGKTKAERAALDKLGCGDYSAHIGARTREALLKRGLIVQVGQRVICQDRFGTVTVPEYAMPPHVHMQWCSAVAFTDEEMAAWEAEHG